MSINEKKPPIKLTVGAMYVAFDKNDDGDYSGTYEENVLKSSTVKSVTVTENSDAANIYASGVQYDQASQVTSADVTVNNIAFDDATKARMRGDLVEENGLHLSGGKRVRPFFAYGHVVEHKGGNYVYAWYPKCKLVENTNEASTKEESYSEQTESLTIHAMPFNDSGDVNTYVTFGDKFPEGLTEAKFFAKPILTSADLTTAVGA